MIAQAAPIVHPRPLTLSAEARTLLADDHAAPRLSLRLSGRGLFVPLKG